MKKFLTLFLFAAILFGLQAFPSFAASTVLSLSSTGSGDSVLIDVSCDPSASVLLSFMKSNGTTYLQYLGTSNSSGHYSTELSSATLDIASGSTVQVKVNNQLSNTVTWPYSATTSTGAITLNQTGLILTVGASSNITVNNIGSSKIYLLNNTNPQVANVSLSGNQETIYANAYGQTVATVCVLGTTSNCASAYITVQNSGAQALTLSQSNLTIAYGQTTQVSILNTTGNYTILNNSNPNVISASINSQTINLAASNNGGAAAITVCATDMSACGIINATVGSSSSTTFSFSQTTPTLSIGQSLPINISGNGGSYNISSNSNSNFVNANINGNTLNLIGNGVGSSVITVCSSQGNCNSLTATVGYASNGGPITLSQTNLWLQAGQAASVVISGGTAPYSFLNDTNSATYFQTSLNNNILTLTGVTAGSASLSVCSAGGACIQLAVLVNGVSSNTQLTFGNNNLSLKTGDASDVTLYGSGGYYISNSVNQNVATIAISGNKATVTAINAGNANATVCQSNGQCGVIYVSVSSSATVSSVTFSNSSPTLALGQNFSVSVSGGSSSNYYISSNSNPSIVQANLSGNLLSFIGNLRGSSVVTVCSASNSCNSISVTVNDAVVAPVVTPSNPTSTSTGSVVPSSSVNESLIFSTGDINSILSNVSATRNTSLEKTYLTRYIKPLTAGLVLSANAKNDLNYFVVYGTPDTFKLGAGERAGVLASYLSAFKKLPVSDAQWADLLKIGTGHFPNELSTAAEKQAKIEFKKIYGRTAVMSSQSDLSAINFIAYGLRSTVRNAASEKSAIKSFRSVYSHDPISSLAWNIVRAIAYSGAKK